MGLDAVVFKNIESMEKAFGRGLFDADAGTGEPLPKPGCGIDISLADTTAMSCRFGNIDEIAHLRREISTVLDQDDSVILSEILYSATHAGDSIAPDKFPRLRIEIDLLMAKKNSSALNSFIEGLEALLRTARQERNPIAFV